MLQESWLPAEARAVQVARSAVRAFPAELDRQTRRDAELLVSELVANAVLRTPRTGRMCLRLRRWDRRLRVEVLEPGAPATSLVASRDPAEAAIMLRMLDAFAGRWGHGPASSGGSLCWFELPLRGGAGPSE